MRALSSDVLERAAGQGLAFVGPTRGVNVDGWLFPESPMKAFAEAREQHVDLMLGTNSQELQRPFFPMSGDFREVIAKQYGTLSDRALALYGLSGTMEPKPDPEFGPVLAQWATDSQFRCGSVAELVWHAAAHNTAYQFQFSRPAPGREDLGAPHGTEVAYVFGTLDPGRHDATDKRISMEMQDYWTNFARTGGPNGGALPQWPKFDPAKRAYLDLTSAGPIAKEGIRRQVCNLYIEKLERQLSPSPGIAQLAKETPFLPTGSSQSGKAQSRNRN